MVTPGRFELPTNSLGNCCSIHLSYGATLLSYTYASARGFRMLWDFWVCFLKQRRVKLRCARVDGMHLKSTQYKKGSIERRDNAKGFCVEVPL
jgi:hypothetical protein